MFESIINHFNTHIDASSGHIESLLPHIAEATHLFSSALLNEKKILCCTCADNFATGSQFCHLLLNGFDFPRPALPALLLGNQTTSLLAMLDRNSTEDIYSRQIQATGAPGDILFIITSGRHNQALSEALVAAHEKQMHVVGLMTGQNDVLASRMGNSDVKIVIQSGTIIQSLLLQYLVSVILAAQLEQQLFGT